MSAGPDEMPESSQHCWSTENHVDTPLAEVTITLQEQVNNVLLKEFRHLFKVRSTVQIPAYMFTAK